MKASTEMTGFRISIVAAALLGAALCCRPLSASTVAQMVQMKGTVPVDVASAHVVGKVPADNVLNFAVVLPLQHQAQLQSVIKSLYDPKSASFGRYLTSGEFLDTYAPSRSDCDAVSTFAGARGFTVLDVAQNRTIIRMSASVKTIEGALGVHMLQYAAPTGRRFFAPDQDPQVPADIASKMVGFVGLSNAGVFHTHWKKLTPEALALHGGPNDGTGVGGGYAPADIQNAYGLNQLAEDGTGQTLGLFELDGYAPSDVTTFESTNAIAPVPLTNVYVGGATGAPSTADNGAGQVEVTLDIELMAGIATGANRIYVYEAPNTDTGVIEEYARIASDDIARSVSTSWGSPELETAPLVRTSEAQSFQQMAAQGQSMFAAAGDDGAYDDPTLFDLYNGQPSGTLMVDDPASQPYITGVGGTSLFTDNLQNYVSETTWNTDGYPADGAGGGGVSRLYAIPSWQIPDARYSVVQNSGSLVQVSTTERDVPDVSLDADPATGYSIYVQNGWAQYGGTSCAAPIWAAYSALVNQGRVASNETFLGFANPSLYSVEQNDRYAFNDIADNSTNIYFPAVTGYDCASGLGTINGYELTSDLLAIGVPPLTPTNLRGTPGNAQVTLAWNASVGATTYDVWRSGSLTGVYDYVGATNTNTFVDKKLKNGTTYYYEVNAFNASGASARTAGIGVTPIGPTATTYLVLKITSGPKVTTQPGKAIVTWTTNVNANSTLLYCINANALVNTLASGALTTTHSLTITGLVSKTKYYYEVQSMDGTETASSAILNWTQP
jgi:kumamolisin